MVRAGVGQAIEVGDIPAIEGEKAAGGRGRRLGRGPDRRGACPRGGGGEFGLEGAGDAFGGQALVSPGEVDEDASVGQREQRFAAFAEVVAGGGRGGQGDGFPFFAFQPVDGGGGQGDHPAAAVGGDRDDGAGVAGESGGGPPGQRGDAEDPFRGGQPGGAVGFDGDVGDPSDLEDGLGRSSFPTRSRRTSEPGCVSPEFAIGGRPRLPDVLARDREFLPVAPGEPEDGPGSGGDLLGGQDDASRTIDEGALEIGDAEGRRKRELLQFGIRAKLAEGAGNAGAIRVVRRSRRRRRGSRGGRRTGQGGFGGEPDQRGTAVAGVVFQESIGEQDEDVIAVDREEGDLSQRTEPAGAVFGRDLGDGMGIPAAPGLLQESPRSDAPELFAAAFVDAGRRADAVGDGVDRVAVESGRPVGRRRER